MAMPAATARVRQFRAALPPRMSSPAPEWAAPGVCFRIAGTSDIYHIRGVVDGYVITCRWSGLKASYKYECLSPKFMVEMASQIKICK